MKQRVYKGIHLMTRNEAVGVCILSLLVIAAYSFWGAHILDNQRHAAASSPISSIQR